MSDLFTTRHLNRLVGVFVISAVAVLVAGAVVIGRARHWFAKEFTVTVAFDRNNLGLLRSGLPVKIQGTEAGEVLAATQDTRSTSARLSLREEFRSQLRRDAKAIIHTPIAGFLGETFIEVWPGQDQQPFNPDLDLITQLPGDDLLQQTRAGIANIGEAAAQVRDAIAENRQQVAETVAAIKRTTVAIEQVVEDNRVAVSAALERSEQVAAQVRDLVIESRPGIQRATEALPAAITAVGTAAEQGGAAAVALGDAAVAMERAATSAAAAIDDNRDGVSDALRELTAVLSETEEVARHVSTISADIAEGRGTLGRLVTDDALHEQAVVVAKKAEDTLDGLQPFVETARNLRLYIGASGGGNTRSGVSTGSAWMRLEPSPDKFYQGGITYRGKPRALDSELKTSDGLPIDVDFLIGFRFLPHDDGHWLSIGVGLLETRLGGIVVSQLYRDRIAVELLARGGHTSRQETDRRFESETVHLRATATVRLAWRLYALAGADELAVKPGPWFGARFELLDNDLRNLTTFGPLFR